MPQDKKDEGLPKPLVRPSGLHAGELPLYKGRSAVRCTEFNIGNTFKLHISRKNVRLNKIGSYTKTKN
jgi:hypothetical protein